MPIQVFNMRLQKFMAEAGIASRRKCEEFINDGKVRVNGNTATIGCVVDPENDIIEYDGKRILIQEKKIVILFNKPKGVICSNTDPQGRKTTSDFFRQIPYRLYNIGRLDYDTEGLLLITNDGDLAYKMMHPSFQIDKVYYVVCSGNPSEDDFKALEKGVMLDDGMTAPAKIENVRKNDRGNTSFYITIHEGRNRQVRRMVEKIGCKTLLLRRVKIGSVSLGKLERGEWRYLDEQEIEKLYNSMLHNSTK